MTLLFFLVENDLKIRAHLMDAMTGLLDVSFAGTARSVPEALDWLTGHQDSWTLAVIDLFIEESTGFAVMTKMQRPSGQQHVVVLTNSATAENRQYALQCGAHVIFDKPTRSKNSFTIAKNWIRNNFRQSKLLAQIQVIYSASPFAWLQNNVRRFRHLE